MYLHIQSDDSRYALYIFFFFFFFELYYDITVQSTHGLFVFCFEQKISIGSKAETTQGLKCGVRNVGHYSVHVEIEYSQVPMRYPSRTHTASVNLTSTIFPPLLKPARYTDTLQNPIHSRRNIIVVINFSYQLRSNFSFSRVIRVGDARISKYRHQ